VWRLRGPGHDGHFLREKVFALERETLVRPRADDEIERLVEALAALLLRDPIAGIVQRRGAAADAEFEAAVAEDVGDRDFLGDLDRVMHRQQRHRRAEADAARPLGRSGQHHQRIGKYRKASTEVKFAEPYRIEPDGVTQ